VNEDYNGNYGISISKYSEGVDILIQVF